MIAVDPALFAERGWAVVRGVLGRSELDELLAALEQLVPEPVYAESHLGRVVEIASISRGVPRYHQGVRHPALARIGRALLGVPRVRLLQDTQLIKPARGGGPVAWHQDYSYFAFLERPAVVTLRLALTPCTEESGCLRVITGSHRWGLVGGDLSFRAQSVDDALALIPPERREEAESRQELLELEPGDVSVHHCLSFHSSRENRSGWARKTLALRLVDADCPVRRELLPDAQASTRVPTGPDGRLAESAFPLLDGGAEIVDDR